MPDMNVRNAQLKQLLTDRRQELQSDLLRRIRDGRSDPKPTGGDALEISDANTSDDVEFALLQMKAETLRRVDEALSRLEAGEYGYCVQCEVEISETRLRAVPFSTRCRLCQEGRELGETQARRFEQHLAGLTRAS
jgi:DnaK suppressor protein